MKHSVRVLHNVYKYSKWSFLCKRESNIINALQILTFVGMTEKVSHAYSSVHHNVIRPYSV